MANRSYLYATNTYNTSAPFTAKGMSEFSYQVHPLYELMVGYETQVADSQIWEQQKIVLVGNLQKGKQLVMDFLELLYERDEAFQTEDFAAFIAETKNFMQEREEKYAWLEAAEIYSMLEDSDLEADNLTYQESAMNYVKEVTILVEKFRNGTLEAAELFNSEFYNDFTDLITEFGEVEIDEVDWNYFWTDILYYNLQKDNAQE